MYPATLSQSSEGLKTSDRRPEQRYEIASEDCSSSLDPTYDPAALEIPPLTRQDAITPSTSRKHDLESTDEDNEYMKPKKKKKRKNDAFVVQNKNYFISKIYHFFHLNKI